MQRWFQLHHEGTSGGSAPGFTHDGYVTLSGAWSGSEGFEAAVGGVGDEAWVSFALKRKCTKFSAGIGGTGGWGQARLTVAVDGEQRFTREFSNGQVQGLSLDVTGKRSVRITATALTDDVLDVALGEPKIYCASTFTKEPRETKRKRWVDLNRKGTSGGDADGFAADGYVTLPGRWTGFAGYAGTVSEDDIEDWTAFKIGKKCNQLRTGIGGDGGWGTAVVQVFLDDKLAYEREFSSGQVEGLTLKVRGTRTAKFVATSTSEDSVTIAMSAPRLYCVR